MLLQSYIHGLFTNYKSPQQSALSRNSLYTFYSRNPTCEIPPCHQISNCKYSPMPSEFHNREPPLPFGNPRSCPWLGMDIFWRGGGGVRDCGILRAWGGNAFWNFRRQWGVKTWKPSVVWYGYFLELPN